MPIRVLHETGEYQRNLSTQVPKQGKNQEDVKLESYYRQLREAARQIDRNQLTYWCDRSAGSPTPLEFSIGSEITPDSSVISEISCVSGDGKHYFHKLDNVQLYFNECRSLVNAV